MRAIATARVLHVINGEHYSGAERVQDLLALELTQFGFDVSFACLKDGKFASTRRSQQADLRTIAMYSRLDLRPAWELAAWLRQEQFALVHTHTPRAAMVGRLAAWIARVPLVHHVHSPTGRDSTRRFQDAISAKAENFSLLGVDAVIAVSRSLASYAAAQGVPLRGSMSCRTACPVIGPLVERATPRRPWTLGTVALFRPRKGLEVLLDALAKLRREGVDVRLRAIGEFETEEYQRKISEQVRRLGIGDVITWTGFTKDVPAELRKARSVRAPQPVWRRLADGRARSDGRGHPRGGNARLKECPKRFATESTACWPSLAMPRTWPARSVLSCEVKWIGRHAGSTPTAGKRPCSRT